MSVGDVLKDAKVASMLGWGAFIEVGNGHRGLLHVDEMKWPDGAMAPSAYDCVKEDQVLEVSFACHLHDVSRTHCSSSLCSVWDGVWLCQDHKDLQDSFLTCCSTSRTKRNPMFGTLPRMHLQAHDTPACYEELGSLYMPVPKPACC